jgi:hypothetical protein
MNLPAERRSSTPRELHVELLLGRVVHDAAGERAGRIEEILVEQRGTDFLVVEYHLGSAAALERIMNFAGEMPLLRLLKRFHAKRRKVPWADLDLTDPEHPRVRRRARELEDAGNGGG